MSLVTLEQAKLQLNIDDSDTLDDALVASLIPVAIGMVEQEIEKEIYDLSNQVPESAINYIVVETLKDTKKAALEMAVKLVLSSLYLYRESELDIDLKKNPAFMGCISGFIDVVVG
jgi:hypothetical protein